jgi:anti-anti-sigma factor
MPGADPHGALPVCTICIQHHSGWTAVMLRGELDYSSARELVMAVRLELSDRRPVIVELVGLDFIDVDGVRALAGLVGEGGRGEGDVRVEIHGARGQVARMIGMLGYEELLPAQYPG